MQINIYIEKKNRAIHLYIDIFLVDSVIAATSTLR